ncbi:arylamine N-acetyltransferase family protein [Psychrobacter sp. FDAARGOS_221]|uniref:arylamine N-acetyltransferase family protein n=1 Tax=Psychrobacter sp. FDAARGOS_221 TaxID=1975705 RepID=UPI000BB59D82|nr:arylamine N-acetyltransferase [Psychrobacter sp. FDAARGOS_221]PNK60715.1 hypothetical protein A6J60_007400 [Psychrobacter sp. FDAARGOS_221]
MNSKQTDTKRIIDHYLETLNIDPDLKTLEDISKLADAHLKAFAFGNPKILVGESVPIDLEGIYNNLVVNKRAGYCFEHNKLMYETLKLKGFEVTQHIARVVNNEAPRAPLTHRVTILYYEGETYLVDVGVGFRSPSVAVKFGDTNEPAVSHLGIPYKVLPVDADKGVYTMQLVEKGKPFNATQFNLIENVEADFQMGNFYSYMNPEGLWRNTLVVSCNTEDSINSLRNNAYFKIHADSTEQIEITEFDQFSDIMQNELKVNYTKQELAQLFEGYVKDKSNNTQ